MSTSHAVQQLEALVSAMGTKTAGKQRIGMQGLQHAISGQKLFMPDDELAAYLRSGAAYMESLRPVGYREEQLAQKIIDANWQLNRGNAVENNLLNAKCLENSAQTKRVTDEATETILAQALAYSEVCGESNAFEALSRRAARVSQFFMDMSRELEQTQEKRVLKSGETFNLEECRAYKWYVEQGRNREAMKPTEPAVKHMRAA